jgi:dTDP-3-amino-3,4,6-trideoxy-alpha-D-glucose transaminase
VRHDVVGHLAQQLVAAGTVELAAALGERGIGARAYYRTPVHRQPAMAAYDPPGDDRLPGTAEAARTHLALPMSAAITREQVGEVIAAIHDARLG